jgi:hypothetical protein
MGLALLIGVIYQITGNLMTKEIRENYPDLYKEIGRPAQIGNLSIKQEWRFFTFLLTRKYASIESRRIRLLGDIAWLCGVANFLLLACLVLFHFDDFRSSTNPR